MNRLLSYGVVAGAFFLAACGSDSTDAQLSPVATVTVAGIATDTATATGTPPASIAVGLAKVVDGVDRPVAVANAGDGSGRLFVIEKEGLVRVVKGGALVAEPFLDVRDLVTDSGNEQGLLGIAFHPDYARNGRFFIAFTAAGSNANSLAEFRAGNPAGDRADRDSGRVLLAIPDTRSNHNGGMVAFGPDGYLYLSTGDGGGGGDPDRAGQDVSTLQGKILRLDVDGAAPFAIPADNPFARTNGARGEIWAYGLRNPWRFSFDRETGDLWIADVGQNEYEEVNLQPAASAGGENYGWSVMEGTHCFRPADGCDTSGKVLPVHEYSHDDGGCSVTGGYRYRGADVPGLRGLYVFVDYCQRDLLALAPDGAGWRVLSIGRTPGRVSAFGEDEAGELYLVSDGDGGLYRITAE
ncbi:MAG: sorbosone dehydrogenase family protein [Dehalococcoidia bacterium]